MSKFSGSMVAIVTPFRDGEFDRDAFANLIERQIEAGTKGIVACGTTGETPCLTDREQIDVVKAAVETCKGRIPVIAGAGYYNTSVAVQRAEAMKEVGVDASLQITPYYNKPSQEGLFQHFRAIAEAVDLPMILYNCPARTGVSLAYQTVARLAEVPNIVALKDAEGKVDYTSDVRAACDLPILSGNDSLTLPIIAVGGVGAISVTANVAPRAKSEIVEEALNYDFKRAEENHRRYLPLDRAMFCESSPAPTKAALAMMGLCRNELRLPLVPATPAAEKRIQATLKDLGLI